MNTLGGSHGKYPCCTERDGINTPSKSFSWDWVLRVFLDSERIPHGCDVDYAARTTKEVFGNFYLARSRKQEKGKGGGGQYFKKSSVGRGPWGSRIGCGEAGSAWLVHSGAMDKTASEPSIGEFPHMLRRTTRKNFQQRKAWPSEITRSKWIRLDPLPLLAPAGIRIVGSLNELCPEEK
jgi:hypothetical protein